MAELFNQDFTDFLHTLHKHDVAYVLVGGYAVILHGYVRSTSDMDVWIKKEESNYHKLRLSFQEFGAPIMPLLDFLGTDFDVWSLGIEPNKIDIMNEVKGLDFEEAKLTCEIFDNLGFPIYFIHINQLLKAKKVSGRFKDLADIEELSKLGKR